MTLATTAGDAFVLTTVFALAARIAGALTWDGALAGFAVGLCVSAGFGMPGLAVLGTFFVLGSIATRVGYARKSSRGAAEARGGARGWRNVVGKGAIAAAIGLLQTFETSGRIDRHLAFHVHLHSDYFVGAVAAALADTLGTEIGALARSEPFLIPSFRRAPAGTPGAVSLLGVVAGAAGAAMVAFVALRMDLVEAHHWSLTAWYAGAGVAASLGESIAVGWAGLKAPGFVRNLLTTALGALLAGCGFIRIMY